MGNEQKELRTVEQHNAEAKTRYDKKLLSGIKCPECGREMRYEYQSLYVDEYPKKRVYCWCGYRGAVLAMPDDSNNLDSPYELEDKFCVEA